VIEIPSSPSPPTPRWHIGCGVVLAVVMLLFVFAVGSLFGSVALQALGGQDAPSSRQESTWAFAGGAVSMVVGVLAFAALVQRSRR
jgi:hypothetical protein